MNHQITAPRNSFNDQWIRTQLEKIPLVGRKVTSSGWPYILAWAHRVTGLLLSVYLIFHILTLSSLSSPAAYEQKMALFRTPFFMFLEWSLAIPVIFHALNGGRLLAYELLGVRDDSFLIRCVLYVSLVYIISLAIFMLLGDQNVSYFFFWLIALIISVFITITLFLTKINHLKSHSLQWKLQRITASLLFILLPAHMLFSHLNMSIGHDPNLIISRISSPFIKVIDLLLLLSIIYHSAYGVYSVIGDYVFNKLNKILFLSGICIVSLIFAYIGASLILSI